MGMEADAVAWYDSYDGPKGLEYSQEEARYVCIYGWNQHLVDFGTSGRDVTEYGATPDMAKLAAYMEYEKSPRPVLRIVANRAIIKPRACMVRMVYNLSERIPGASS